MRDLLVSFCRQRMPIWEVRRHYFHPGTKIKVSLVVGKWRAWTRDEAIEKAAHAIQGIALLTAEQFFCGSQQEKGK
jgi:hypothetical protein